MTRHLSRRLGALVVALLAASAHADSVRLDDFAIPGPSGLAVTVGHMPGVGWHGAAGQFAGVLDAASFLTYCVELPQHADFGTLYTNYAPVDGAVAFGAAKADDLARLVSHLGMSPRWSTESALAQAAIWEVVHEPGRSYSFTGGEVRAQGLDAQTQDWLDGFDWSAALQATPVVRIGALASPTNQDFLTVTPVPEPGTYALLGLGLGLVALAARRQRKAAS
jgi:hypothetical protein